MRLTMDGSRALSNLAGTSAGAFAATLRAAGFLDAFDVAMDRKLPPVRIVYNLKNYLVNKIGLGDNVASRLRGRAK